MATATAPQRTVSWQPQERGINEICALLEHQISPVSSADKTQIWQQLQHYSQFPDFCNYLAFILARGEGNSIEVRQAAGLLLKNSLKTLYASMDPANQLYIKAELLPCLGATERNVRSTVGTILSVIIQLGGVAEFPELLQAMISCLDGNNPNHMEGALDALYKICEDSPQALDSDIPGFPDRPIEMLLPRLYKCFQSPLDSLRKLALGCVNPYIMLMPSALSSSMNQYLHGLFSLARDPSPEVRKLVCSAFVQITDLCPVYLEGHLREIIEYILQVNKDDDDDVALEACEFWCYYCNGQLPLPILREYLPRLIPVLLSNMVYADDDESVLCTEDDEDIPDRDQDIKPRFPASKIHGSDHTDNDNDEVVSVWNLRKCSAAALDYLSTVYEDGILPSLMPIVQAKLSAGGDINWKERESAVLALGAVSEGCINGLYPHLSQIVDFIIPLLDDKFPLIRSISCWTLSRYSKYIVQVDVDAHHNERIEKVLSGLLNRILDKNKRVQESACSALATFEDVAGEVLVPHIRIILQHLMHAFAKYQRRNLRIVYDAIGSLADAVGRELNKPDYLEILLPPLISKWQQLPNHDKDLFPLFECMTSIAQALGQGFSQFAQPVFQRCIDIIQNQQMAKVNAVSSLVPYDKEFVVCSLDLLSGLTEGLGVGIESLVSESNLRDILLQCCMDEASDVTQSAFALLGDLAKACIVHLRPRLPEFMDIAAKKLIPSRVQESISAANNACWAIGEIAMKIDQEISPIVVSTVSSLAQILQHIEGMNKSLRENSTITLGKLALACPKLVSPHMEHFMQGWCMALSMLRDDIEKEFAFRGLCEIVKLNPSGAVSSFLPMCKAIASWHEIKNPDLENSVCQVLLGYKQVMKGEVWEQYMSVLEEPVKQKLSTYLCVVPLGIVR